MPQIRSTLNISILALVFVLALSLVWVGSRVSLAWAVPAGIVFSFVLLTNYALLHEGAHDNLHADPHLNRWLGVLAGLLFPIPFSMLRVTHTVHHCCNRTDHEMFDLYYPSDNMFLKRGQWYSLLCGFFWPWIPVGTVLLATFPGLLRTTPFRRARTTAVLFDDFEAHGISHIRTEAICIVMFWAAVFWVLELKLINVLLMYTCFAFNWSTRQYVTHAFTPRDVVNGALNLKVSQPMSWLLLKGNWDLVHHQKPWLPWTELEAHGAASQPPVSFWSQYLRMWRGPVPATEPAPERLIATPALVR